MSLLFIGSFYLSAILEKIANNKYVGNANDLLQKAYIKGLSSICKEREIEFISYTLPNVPAYPKPGSRFVYERMIEDINEASCVSLPFLNPPLIKHVNRFFSAYKAILCRKDITHILIYDIDIPLLCAAHLYKKKRNVYVGCVVPDLIGLTGGPNTLLHKLYQKLLNRLLGTVSTSINLFIYLTESMHERLGFSNPYIVIEGIYNDENEELLRKDYLPNLSVNKTILYAGAMSKRNGVLKLLNVFKLISDEDFQLILCGDGELRNVIEEMSMVDKRIRFMGNIPHSEVQLLQRSVGLLVNPRPAIEEFSKYSFPSKTLEYFASGTPTMMFRLPGIPDEYYKYCYTFESYDERDMCNRILAFFCKPFVERVTKGQAARSFILQQKNCYTQCCKIISMMDYNIVKDVSHSVSPMQ